MNLIIIFLIALISISNTLASSYSKVFVERHSAPVEYLQYGAPYSSILTPRLAEINSLPTANLPPCGSPCLISGQVPLNHNTVLTYQPALPSVPVAVAPAEDASGYQYSYVVYDDSTGDHKAQHELSDGGVVRGEYSFLQPDGYVREVQYEADDVKGFNAVVKNFLPQNKDISDASPPCPEVKLENLKDARKAYVETTSEQVDSASDAATEVTESSENFDNNPRADTSDNASTKITTPASEIVETSEESKDIPCDPTDSTETSESNKDTTELDNSQDISTEISVEQTNEIVTEEVKVDDTRRELKDTNESTVEGVSAPAEMIDRAISESDVLVPYQDILSCIQAAINKANALPSRRNEPSPLTYIILNKPCYDS